MKFKNILAVSAFFFLLNMLFAEESGFSSYFGSYGLDEYATNDTSFLSFFQWGGNIYYTDSTGLDENLGYYLELDADPLLKYRLKSEININTPFYTISLGPIFGIIEQSWTLIKPGFCGSIQFQVPGRVYAEFGGDLIPLTSTLAEDDYSSFSSFYTIGYYVKKDHILCHFTQKRDQFTAHENGTETVGSRVNYLFYADFFEKNSILKVQSKMGYEILNQILSETNSVKLESIIFGIQLDFNITGNSSVFISLDNMVYPTSSGSQELEEIPGYLYTFKTGFKWYR